MPMKYIKTSILPRVDDPTLNRALDMMDEELAKIARVFIDWTADAGANNIHDDNILASSITQHEGLIDHDALLGFVDNEHKDHTAISITAGTGLAGGGTIAANRTINLSHLGIESLADPGADRILFWDDSEGAFKWLQVLGSGLTIWNATFYWSWLGLESLAEDPAHESILWFSGPVGGLEWGDIGTGLDLDTGTLKTKDSEIVHDNLSGFVASEHKSLPNTIAQVLSDHNLAAHTALGLFDQHSDVDHNQTTNYAANQHVVLPNTIANVLSDHNLATHNALGITTLGTIETGVWQGTAINNAYIDFVNLPSDENLVGYWSFDEGSGTLAVDGSGNGNNGTIVGAQWVDGGVVGKCLDFDGVDDYVSLESLIDETVYTLSFRIGNYVEDTFDFLFGATGQIKTFLLNYTGSIGFREEDRTYDTFIDNSNIKDGTYHVVFVSDGTDIKLYIDSVYKATVTPTSTAFAMSRINAGYSTRQYLVQCTLDEIRIYNRALTEEEIKALYLYPAGNKAVRISRRQVTGLDQDLLQASSPTHVTAKLTALTDGYVPYHVSDAAGLANSPIRIDGANVGIGKVPTCELDVNGKTLATAYKLGAFELNSLIADNKVPDSNRLNGQLASYYSPTTHNHDHGALSGLGDDDHAQYYNATRHTKAVHDALLISELAATINLGAGASKVQGGTTLQLEAGASGVCSETISGDETAVGANMNIAGAGENCILRRSTSAIKNKNLIENLEVDSKLLYNLRPVSFSSKCLHDDKKRRFIGLIADEIEKVIPEVILYNKNKEVESYDNQMLMTLILAETQRHEARIKELEARLNN